jgi:hypothetical protein
MTQLLVACPYFLVFLFAFDRATRCIPPISPSYLPLSLPAHVILNIIPTIESQRAYGIVVSRPRPLRLAASPWGQWTGIAGAEDEAGWGDVCLIHTVSDFLFSIALVEGWFVDVVGTGR